jgi:hypothetical protein
MTGPIRKMLWLHEHNPIGADSGGARNMQKFSDENNCFFGIVSDVVLSE